MTTSIKIDWLAKELFLKETSTQDLPYLVIAVLIGLILFKGTKIMFKLPNDRNAQLSVSGVDSEGNPAELEGVTYTSSNPDVATVDETGLVTSVSVGSAQISVTADARLGEGEVLLTGLLDIEVIAGEAVAFEINARLV